MRGLSMMFAQPPPVPPHAPLPVPPPTDLAKVRFVLASAPAAAPHQRRRLKKAARQGGLFAALAPWFARVPGRLIHTNIAASVIFAATTGRQLGPPARAVRWRPWP